MKIRHTRTCFILAGWLCLANLWGQQASSVEHTIAAIEKDRFHGWPANNGAWQWGNEILVGFTQGDFEVQRGHNITGREDSLFSRSLDGGKTWRMFDPSGFLDDENPRFYGGGKTVLEQSMDFSQPDFALRIFAQGYHGNEDPDGGFYYSYDRGRTWQGPFALNGLASHPEMKGKILSPRTDYLVLGPRRAFLFITAQDPSETLDLRIACIQTSDGGRTFEFVSWVTPDFGTARATMPQTVQLSGTEFILSFRKIHDQGVDEKDSIEAYRSVDGGSTWHPLSTIKVMQSHSNPPALVKLRDGRLCCAYGDRYTGEVRARCSVDDGSSWGPEAIIRDDFLAMQGDPDSETSLNTDMGYVRLVQRPDGKLVAMYYYATAEHPQQHIAVSIWTP